MAAGRAVDAPTPRPLGSSPRPRPPVLEREWRRTRRRTSPAPARLAHRRPWPSHGRTQLRPRTSPRRGTVRPKRRRPCSLGALNPRRRTLRSQASSASSTAALPLTATGFGPEKRTSRDRWAGPADQLRRQSAATGTKSRNKGRPPATDVRGTTRSGAAVRRPYARQPTAFMTSSGRHTSPPPAHFAVASAAGLAPAGALPSRGDRSRRRKRTSRESAVPTEQLRRQSTATGAKSRNEGRAPHDSGEGCHPKPGDTPHAGRAAVSRRPP